MNKTLLTYNKTYNAGLLQAKAFRILKKHTNSALLPFGISATEWVILGLLSNQSEGLRLSEIAALVGVKSPFVTRSIAILVEKDFVDISISSQDTRVKIAMLTKVGETFVLKTEPVISQQIKKTFNGVSIRNLYGYITTLHTISETYPVDGQTILLSHLED